MSTHVKPGFLLPIKPYDSGGTKNRFQLYQAHKGWLRACYTKASWLEESRPGTGSVAAVQCSDRRQR